MYCTIYHARSFREGPCVERLVVDIDSAIVTAAPVGVRLQTTGSVLASLRTRVPLAASFDVCWLHELFFFCRFDARTGAIHTTREPPRTPTLIFATQSGWVETFATMVEEAETEESSVTKTPRRS